MVPPAAAELQPDRLIDLKTEKAEHDGTLRHHLRSTSGLLLWLNMRFVCCLKSCIYAARRCWRLRAMIPTDAEMASPLQGEIG